VFDWPALIVVIGAAILATLTIVVAWELDHDTKHRP
jgi:hypothetical protein